MPIWPDAYDMTRVASRSAGFGQQLIMRTVDDRRHAGTTPVTFGKGGGSVAV